MRFKELHPITYNYIEMVNYKKGKIYKLFNKVNDKYYIGSTCSSLPQRKKGHKNESKKKPNILKNKEILKIGWLDSNGGQNWFMKKICDFPCDCKGELVKEEGKHIRLCIEKDGDLVLNKRIEGRTKKEWIEDNKERIKQWKEDNKEKIKVQTKNYREKPGIKDNIKVWRKGYRENNKDKIRIQIKKYRERPEIKERIKEYYESNKNKIKLYQKEKIKCECGLIISRGYKSQHIKKKKHLQLLPIRKDLEENK